MHVSPIDDNDDLRDRKAPVDMSPDEFRAVGHMLVEEIARFLESLPGRPVTRHVEPGVIRALLPGHGAPEHGEAAARLFEEALPLLIEHSLFNGHPRFLGYVTSSAAPLGALADLVASALNPNLGSWALSPVASEIEAQCVRWLAELMGIPGHGHGLLVSGGNMANFVCFLAARRAKATSDIRTHGLAGHPGKLLVYASTETHTWIHKAADLFGHGTDGIRWIDVDAEQRMDLTALQRRIQADVRAGHRPFLLVGNAGTVSTGAVDPLASMASMAAEHDLWFHVDGAYGAPAAMVPHAPPELAGLGHADSVAVDPHKWLYVPLEAGCVLVRDDEILRKTFSHTPPYYVFTGEESDPRINYYELGPQNSRGFRALKVWLGLRHVGRTGYAKMIAEDMALGRALHERVARENELEAGTQGLSITTFRYVPADLAPGDEGVDEYLDALNEELLRRLKASGEVFLSNASVRGRFMLRACIVNFRTSQKDIEALPEIVIRHGRQADRDMRPGKLHIQTS